MSGPLIPDFTLPARLVIVGCFLGALLGTAASIGWIWDGLPPGSYPLWLFAFPVFIAAGMLAAGLLALLRACGVRLIRPRPGPDPGMTAEPPAAPDRGSR